MPGRNRRWSVSSSFCVPQEERASYANVRHHICLEYGVPQPDETTSLHSKPSGGAQWKHQLQRCCCAQISVCSSRDRHASAGCGLSQISIHWLDATICTAVAHRGNLNAGILHPGLLREHMPHQSISSVQHVQSPLVLFLSLNELEDLVPNFGHRFPSDVPLRLVHGTLRGKVARSCSRVVVLFLVSCGCTRLDQAEQGAKSIPRERSAVTRLSQNICRDVAQ